MQTTPETQNVGGKSSSYGVNATYKAEIPVLTWEDGVIPQDTLPAEWWNWIWEQITGEQLHTVQDLSNLFTEINNVFQQAGITPSADDLTQIKQAILKLADQKLASYIDTVSINKGQIQFTDDEDPADKKLYVPVIGDTTQLSTADKTTLTAAINEVVTKGGDLTDLETTIKTSLVNAINEVRFLALSGATGNVPVGTILAFGGSVAPDGFLICDGSAYSVAEYPALYSVIGTNYGYTQSGIDFKIPDYRGGVGYGADNEDFMLGANIAAQDSQHTHQYTLVEALYGRAVSAGTDTTGAMAVVRGLGTKTVQTTTPSTSNNNKGPLVKGTVVNYIIKAR